VSSCDDLALMVLCLLLQLPAMLQLPLTLHLITDVRFLGCIIIQGF
jgi:hypothetical protein